MYECEYRDVLLRDRLLSVTVSSSVHLAAFCCLRAAVTL